MRRPSFAPSPKQSTATKLKLKIAQDLMTSSCLATQCDDAENSPAIHLFPIFWKRGFGVSQYSFFRRLVNQKYYCKRQTATMKIKLSKNLKKIKPFGAGRKGRSDESIAASELLEDHLGMSGSNLDDGEQDGDDDNVDDAKNDAETASRPTDDAAGAGADEQSAERQGDDDDHDDDASDSTQARLGRSISYVLREDERKHAKKEARAAVAAGRDEVESSGRPPLPPTQHSHSSSRSSSGSSSSGGGRQREGAATGAAPVSADGTKLTRDRSIRSRDESIGSIEIKANESVDTSVYDQQKTADHGSKMVFEFDKDGIQNVDLTKLSSSHDSDDSSRCPTVIMDDETIEIVNSLSDASSVTNDHHRAKMTNKSTSGGSNKVGADTETQQTSQYKITGADRIILRVADIEKSIVFYSKLGFKRIERPTHLKKPQEAEAFHTDDAWLSNGKVTIYLLKGEPENLKNIPTPTMSNISFYTSRAEEAIALLQKTNVPFVANVRVIGSGIDEHRFRQAFIRDPDANYIEISNLNASTVAIKVSSEDSGTEEQSKPVVVGNIMRRLMSEADLRPSFNDAELDLEFDDVIDQAMDLMKSLSDSHMTTVPTNILSFIDKHSREKSQQQLKSSRSASYLDAARKEKKNPAGIKELISSNTSSDIGTPMLRVNHLSLAVSDVKTSIKFYTEIMGLEEVKLPSTSKVDIGSVIAGDVIIHLVPGEPPRAHNPLEGQVFLNVSGISTTLRAFQEKKVPYRIHFAGDPAKSESNASLVEAFVSDPDGYVIVIGNYTEAAQKKCAIAGNSSQIKPIPRQYQPTAVDSNVLRNFARRRKFEGDVCYQFNRNDLKKLLLQAGNDAPTALQLMKQHREKEAKKRAEKEDKSSKTQVEAETASIASLICCMHCGGCC